MLEETITFSDDIKTHCIIIKKLLWKFISFSFHIACTFYLHNEFVFDSKRGFLFFRFFYVSAKQNVVLIQEKSAYLITLIRPRILNQTLFKAFCGTIRFILYMLIALYTVKIEILTRVMFDVLSKNLSI